MRIVGGRSYLFEYGVAIYLRAAVFLRKPAEERIALAGRFGGQVQRFTVSFSVGSYSMYYFSLNLEHILHGRTNLSDWEKIRCAEEFDLKYGDDPDGFTLFMKESSFSVCDDYRRSWAFIKTELHSLERYSNFGIELPPLKTATPQTNR